MLFVIASKGVNCKKKNVIFKCLPYLVDIENLGNHSFSIIYFLWFILPSSLPTELVESVVLGAPISIEDQKTGKMLERCDHMFTLFFF